MHAYSTFRNDSTRPNGIPTTRAVPVVYHCCLVASRWLGLYRSRALPLWDIRMSAAPDSSLDFLDLAAQWLNEVLSRFWKVPRLEPTLSCMPVGGA